MSWRRALKGARGVLMLIIGLLFATAPVISALPAVSVSGWILLVVGAVETTAAIIPVGPKPTLWFSVISGLFPPALGMIVVIGRDAVMEQLPAITSTVLAGCGMIRSIQGARRHCPGMADRRWYRHARSRHRRGAATILQDIFPERSFATGATGT